MSFREKTAWITLCAIVLVTLMYWFHVPSLYDQHHVHWIMKSMLLSLAAYVVIEVIAYVVLYLRSPKDARTPRDERERLIDLKALRVAYYVFAAGAIGGIFVTLHLVGAGPGALGMVVFGAFVFAQLVKHAARIVYYRRGA